MKEKLELLAPAGNMGKLKIAIQYGADAVYFAGEAFGLRSGCQNFTRDELKEAVSYCHERSVKAYITVNSYPRNREMDDIPQYLAYLAEIGVDAVLVSDLGVFHAALPYRDQFDIHISTQANNVNYASASYFHELGASRVVLARELSLEEIKGIREKAPPKLELEAFVHGAMCISYSGRCLLSDYLVGRDANRGDCAQPCRWKYYLQEEKRAGQDFEIIGEKDGTFIMNSKDLCLIRHLPELVEAGVTSLKIEGRIKTEYYLATVVSAYRQALDAYLEHGAESFDERWYDELLKVSHRDYCTGFLFGDDGKNQRYDSSSYIREYDMTAYVEGYDSEKKLLICRQRNKFLRGDELELLTPGNPFELLSDVRVFDEAGTELESAPHADQLIFISYGKEVPAGSILRKKK